VGCTALADSGEGVTFYADRPPEQLTILMLKENTVYVVTDYWLEGAELHYTAADGEHKVPLGRLDLNETVRLNHQRNVEIVLHGKEESEP